MTGGITPSSVQERQLEDDCPIGVVADRDDRSWALTGQIVTVNNSHPWLLKIEPSAMWTWCRTEPETIEHLDPDKRDHGPPRDVQRGLEDNYDLMPGLSPKPGNEVSLMIPEPVPDSKGVRYYAPDPCGTVSVLGTGKLFDIEIFLPDDAPENGSIP